MRCRFKLILLFFLLITSVASYAQEPDTTVIEEADTLSSTTATDSAREVVALPVIYNNDTPSGTNWKTITSDRAYGYKDKVEYVAIKEPPPQRESAFIRFLNWLFSFFASTAGTVFFIILLVLIVGFILYRILNGEGNRLFGKASKNLQDAETIITGEDLFTNNWDARLQAALKEGNMRLAIRYSYMMLLQMLQKHELIQYRQDKTNSEYYRELSGNDYRLPFRQLSRQYETAWYGAYLPSQEAFGEYMAVFNDIKNKLGS